MVGPFLHRKQFPHLHSLQVLHIQAPVKYNNKTCSIHHNSSSKSTTERSSSKKTSINYVEELPLGIEKVI